MGIAHSSSSDDDVSVINPAFALSSVPRVDTDSRPETASDRLLTGSTPGRRVPLPPTQQAEPVSSRGPSKKRPREQQTDESMTAITSVTNPAFGAFYEPITFDRLTALADASAHARIGAFENMSDLTEPDTFVALFYPLDLLQALDAFESDMIRSCTDSPGALPETIYPRLLPMLPQLSALAHPAAFSLLTANPLKFASYIHPSILSSGGSDGTTKKELFMRAVEYVRTHPDAFRAVQQAAAHAAITIWSRVLTMRQKWLRHLQILSARFAYNIQTRMVFEPTVAVLASEGPAYIRGVGHDVYDTWLSQLEEYAATMRRMVAPLQAKIWDDDWALPLDVHEKQLEAAARLAEVALCQQSVAAAATRVSTRPATRTSARLARYNHARGLLSTRGVFTAHAVEMPTGPANHAKYSIRAVASWLERVLSVKMPHVLSFMRSYGHDHRSLLRMQTRGHADKQPVLDALSSKTLFVREQPFPSMAVAAIRVEIDEPTQHEQCIYVNPARAPFIKLQLWFYSSENIPVPAPLFDAMLLNRHWHIPPKQCMLGGVQAMLQMEPVWFDEHTVSNYELTYTLPVAQPLHTFVQIYHRWKGMESILVYPFAAVREANEAAWLAAAEAAGHAAEPPVEHVAAAVAAEPFVEHVAAAAAGPVLGYDVVDIGGDNAE